MRKDNENIDLHKNRLDNNRRVIYLKLSFDQDPAQLYSSIHLEITAKRIGQNLAFKKKDFSLLGMSKPTKLSFEKL